MCSSACVIVLMIVGGQVGANIPDFDVYPNDVLFRFDKSMSKVNDLDVRNALQALNATLQRYNEFQQWSGGFESRDASINGRIGVFLFTRYCGPGARFLNRIFQTDERTYTRIDSCCRKHDECPDYVLRSDDYERYPELDVRPQFFSRFVTNTLKCHGHFSKSKLTVLSLVKGSNVAAIRTFINAWKVSTPPMPIQSESDMEFSSVIASNTNIQSFSATNITRKIFDGSLCCFFVF